MFLQLLVLELQVFELFAEHEARSEAGTYRPFRLRSTLASDDSLRRVAYGSQGAHFRALHRVTFGKTPQVSVATVLARA